MNTITPTRGGGSRWRAEIHGDEQAQRSEQRSERERASSTASAAREPAGAGARCEPSPAPAGDPAGLVTSAETARVSAPAGQRATPHNFASLDECTAGAAAVGPWQWDGREGPVPMLEVAPGLVRLSARDLNRAEKRANKERDEPVMPYVDGHDQEGDGGDEPEGIIRGWSARSRARMVATMAELDLAPLLWAEGEPAMVTLTYPGDWETVAPDGPTTKAHLRTFFERYKRAWGEPWRGVWKLEFQRRGAPHYHLLMVPPSGLASTQRRAEYEAKRALWESADRATRGPSPRWRSAVGDGLGFRAWLSQTWADIVAHPDPEERERHVLAGTGVDFTEGDRARDPKRAAVYFGKHGSFAAKDYQHKVPKLWEDSGLTVGRFWGYRELRKIRGAATISFDEMLLLGRTLRRYGTRTRVWDPVTREHRVRPVLRTVYRQRGTRSGWNRHGEYVTVPYLRKTTVRARRMTGPHSAGFLLVNDGPEMARMLARVLETCAASEQEAPAPVGLRGPISERC